MNDTEAVPRQFLKTSIKRKKHSALTTASITHFAIGVPHRACSICYSRPGSNARGPHSTMVSSVAEKFASLPRPSSHQHPGAPSFAVSSRTGAPTSAFARRGGEGRDKHRSTRLTPLPLLLPFLLFPLLPRRQTSSQIRTALRKARSESVGEATDLLAFVFAVVF